MCFYLRRQNLVGSSHVVQANICYNFTRKLSCINAKSEKILKQPGNGKNDFIDCIR